MTGGPGPTLAGFRLLRAIGQGASGTVHLAEHKVSGAVVAMKIVPLPVGAGQAEAGQRFLQATQAAMRLRHPGIVQVLDAGVQDTLAWITMEPVPGADLVRYTRAPRLLPEAVALNIAARLALALAHAHGLGIIHRDLKPANVLVNWADNSVKLADFGLARAGGAVETGTGIVLGTPAYMAPEQLAGAVPGAATDFYALGVLLFELLTGRLPHEASSMGELLRQVAQVPPPELLLLRPGLPPGLGQVLAQLLAKAPSDRPADGAALAASLQALARALPGAGAKSR